jgi:hypothetical protein
METSKKISVESYSEIAIPHLRKLVTHNQKTMDGLAGRLVKDVRAGKSLLVFGSGHSAIFPLELYHRAGGASFVIHGGRSDGDSQSLRASSGRDALVGFELRD